jgi:lysozyme
MTDNIPKELSEIVEDIKKHEGFEPKVYECTEGYDTIGYGFAIKDLVLDKDIADLILMKKLHKLLQRIVVAFPWFKDINNTAKSVIVNMCYQLGLSGFSKFKKTIYLLETEQYEEASVEMLDSLWAKQTPNRAKELSETLRSIDGHTKNNS